MKILSNIYNHPNRLIRFWLIASMLWTVPCIYITYQKFPTEESMREELSATNSNITNNMDVLRTTREHCGQFVNNQEQMSSCFKTNLAGFDRDLYYKNKSDLHDSLEKMTEEKIEMELSQNQIKATTFGLASWLTPVISALALGYLVRWATYGARKSTQE